MRWPSRSSKTYGQLTFFRVYQGTISKGESYFNQRTGQKERFSRIVRMHADQREDIDTAEAGDIVAVMGVDCASGDTYCSRYPYCTLESMFVPEPVIKMAIEPAKRDGADKLGKALHRFRREDPTFRVLTDEETGETMIAGMGELHLEIYVERIRREYGVRGRSRRSRRSATAKPRPRPIEFNYKHKKQTGGSGQYAHIVGHMEPLPEDSVEPFEFENEVVGAGFPRNTSRRSKRASASLVHKGPVAGYPVVGLKCHSRRRLVSRRR